MIEIFFISNNLFTKEINVQRRSGHQRDDVQVLRLEEDETGHKTEYTRVGTRLTQYTRVGIQVTEYIRVGTRLTEYTQVGIQVTEYTRVGTPVTEFTRVGSN